jgi:predicted GNAT family acetyltransferase
VTPLDNPVWASLCSGHEKLAIRSERAARYPEEISPLAGLAEPSREALNDLACLVAPEGFAGVLAGPTRIDEQLWQERDRIELIQMVGEAPVSPPDTEPGPLTAADVPEMLSLAEQTRPGPFEARTLEMGRYVGLREEGRLIAMGGERLRPTGHTEVSAICSAESHRGKGLAETIVRSLVAAIQARGELPFLHVMAGSPSEAGALRLYGRLGFRERRRAQLVILQRL